MTRRRLWSPVIKSNVDLHVHSLYSDGLLSPAQLCEKARRLGVAYLALCDHDTVSGLPAFMEAAQTQGLTALAGLELSCGEEGTLHVLGYGAPQNDPRLTAELQSAAQRRKQRGEKMLLRLRQLGIDVPAELLPQGKAMSRAHVARALIALKVVGTMSQAFERYLAQGRPAYVPQEHLSAAQAVRLLSQVGAVPVLAHPLRTGLTLLQTAALVEELIPLGLCGMEVYHPSASRQNTRLLDAMARQRGLLVTGGSDFHGDPNTRVQLGSLPAGWSTREDDVQALLSKMNQ